MLGLYLFSLLFGGVLIGFSLLMGGGDHGGADHGMDHDHDTDHGDAGAHDEVTMEHDHEHDHSALAQAGHETLWLPFLSLRFWTFFMAAFGATGLLLSLIGLSSILVALISLPNGLLVGTAVSWFFHTLSRDMVSAPTGLDHLIGQEATVVLPIEIGDLGQIAVITASGRLELPARSYDRELLGPGALVMIAAIKDGTAEVTATPGPKAISDRRRQSTDQ